MASDGLVRCSFCNRSQRDAKRIITGPSVAICDQCVDLCDEILEDPVAGASTAELPDITPAARCALCRVPSEHLIAIGERGVLCAECVEAVRT